MASNAFRQWTITGHPPAAFPAIDQAVAAYMEANSIRAGSLAIGRGGIIVFEHAYTWAEPGYPIARPESPFRLASLSKAFTCAAIQSLYDAKRLDLKARVFPLLGITSAAFPWQSPDPRINLITIQQLVDHVGGWDTTTFDPTDHMRDIALKWELCRPPSKLEIARYMYGEPLQYDPGTTYSYSNFGYVLLTLVIESLTGKTLAEFLLEDVLNSDRISEVFLAHTSPNERLPEEGLYDNPDIGPSVFHPCLDEQLPCAYGGSWVTESMDGDGGLAATARAVVQLIGKHAIWGVGPRAPGNDRSGRMAGTTSWAQSCCNGIDFAYIFNTDNVSEAASAMFRSQIRWSLGL